MNAATIATFSLLIAAASLQLVSAHSYMSSPPCFNCPSNPAETPADVKLVSDPMKVKALCRGVAKPQVAKATLVNGDQLEIEINAVIGHPGTCKFSLLDSNLKNPVALLTQAKCLAKTGRQKFTVPLKGQTGIKVIQYQWDDAKGEHYESCALVNITGAAKSKAKGKAKAKAKSAAAEDDAEVKKPAAKTLVRRNPVEAATGKASTPAPRPAPKMATDKEIGQAPSKRPAPRMATDKEVGKAPAAKKLVARSPIEDVDAGKAPAPKKKPARRMATTEELGEAPAAKKPARRMATAEELGEAPAPKKLPARRMATDEEIGEAPALKKKPARRMATTAELGVAPAPKKLPARRMATDEEIGEVPAPKKKPARRMATAEELGEAPAPKKKAAAAAKGEFDDEPSMAELEALFSGKDFAGPQEAGWNDDDEEETCTPNETECDGSGFRKCGGDGKWVDFACGAGTSCQNLDATSGLTCGRA